MLDQPVHDRSASHRPQLMPGIQLGDRRTTVQHQPVRTKGAPSYPDAVLRWRRTSVGSLLDLVAEALQLGEACLHEVLGKDVDRPAVGGGDLVVERSHLVIAVKKPRSSTGPANPVKCCRTNAVSSSWSCQPPVEQTDVLLRHRGVRVTHRLGVHRRRIVLGVLSATASDHLQRGLRPDRRSASRPANASATARRVLHEVNVMVHELLLLRFWSHSLLLTGEHLHHIAPPLSASLVAT